MGCGASVAAKDALELWDNIGRNHNRVLRKESFLPRRAP